MSLYQFDAKHGKTVLDRTTPRWDGYVCDGEPDYVLENGAPIEPEKEKTTILSNVGGSNSLVVKDAASLYMRLHQYYARHEARPYQTVRASWNGVLPKQPMFLLQQLALRNNLDNAITAYLHCINFVAIDRDIGIYHSALVDSLTAAPKIYLDELPEKVGCLLYGPSLPPCCAFRELPPVCLGLRRPVLVRRFSMHAAWLDPLSLCIRFPCRL